MDLTGYALIGFFGGLLAANGIDIPRLRSIKLMSEEKPVEVKKAKYFGYFAYDLIRDWFVKEAVRKYMPWQLHEYSITKNKKHFNRFVRLGTNTEWCVDRYYNYYNGDSNKPFPWHRFHGKLRKRLKHLYKQRLKKTKEQFDVFNSYVGNRDILCIRARIGGNNWGIYGGKEIEKQPWFLKKVDDCFDNTYCDIYVSLAEV